MPKRMENPLKIDLWALLGTPCGTTLAPLGKHFGHLFPKDWILETWRRVLGVQKGQLGSNLEAQDPPKQNPKYEKSMLKNNTFLASIFKGFGRRFGMVSGRILGPKMHAKSDMLNCVQS